MTNLKKLELEFEGIRRTILSYTSQGNVVNYLDGLKEKIELKDKEAIIYYLTQLCEWYNNNIGKIRLNEFVTEPDDHERNKQLLQNILDGLCIENEYKEVGKIINDNIYSKIFLSHNSNDKKYGDAIRDLLINIGIEKEQLIYTSHPLHKIPTGNDIFDYLKNNINKDILVIFLWSNDYLKSAACLNEMGAAWIIESEYINVYVPNFDFNNPQYHNCAVNTKKMGIILNSDEQCKMGMIEIKQKIEKSFGLSIDEQTWIFYLDEFMKNIN